MTNDGAMIDPRTGIAIPQTRTAGRVGMKLTGVSMTGVITYRCYTCGESIVKPWECLFVDITPGREYASHITPAKTWPGTTTHHDWHMASEQ